MSTNPSPDPTVSDSHAATVDATDTTGSTTGPTTGPARSLTALRVTAALTLISTAAQPVLAGMFLDHNVAALEAHATNAGILHLAQLAQLVAAWVYWRPGGGRSWPLLLTVVLWLLAGLQFGLGDSANLTGHVPVGVAIVLAQALLTLWSFGKNATRPRRSGPARRPRQRGGPAI